MFRLLEEVYIEVFNESILTHTIRAQNVSKDTFCENAFKKECISKLQQCLYQSHGLNLKTKRNHSCIEFSLKQKWSLIFWISIYPNPVTILHIQVKAKLCLWISQRLRKAQWCYKFAESRKCKYQNWINTYFPNSKWVQGGSPANRGFELLVRFLKSI